MSTTGPRLCSPDADAQGWISVGPKGASLRLEGVEGVELRAASVVLQVASDDLILTWLGQSRREGATATVAQPSGFTLALESGDDNASTEWLTADWGDLRALRGLTVKLASNRKNEPIISKDSELESELESKYANKMVEVLEKESETSVIFDGEALDWSGAADAWGADSDTSDALGTGTPTRDCRVSLSVGGPWFPSGEAELKSGSAHTLPSLLASRAKIELLYSGALSAARLAELTFRLSDQPESLALRGDGGTYGLRVGPTRANEQVTLSDPAWVELINRRLRAGETPELGLIASRPGRVKLVSASLDVVRVHDALQRRADESGEADADDETGAASLIAEDPVWVHPLNPADGAVVRHLELGAGGKLTELAFTTSLGPGSRPTLLDMPRAVSALRRGRAIDPSTAQAQALTHLRGPIAQIELALCPLTAVVEGRIELHPDVLGRPSGVASGIWPLRIDAGEPNYDTRWVSVPLDPAPILDTSRVWLVVVVTEGELSWAFEPGANTDLGGVASRISAGPWTPSGEGWLPVRLHGPPSEAPEPPTLELRRGLQTVTVPAPGPVTLRQSELDLLNESTVRLMSLRLTPKTRAQLTLRGLRAVIAPA
ncbi:MAG: hypothetical protein IPN01_00440 [Deltaproteobacteria bacterium]|nr:hypothetical protein [Deltaproteobacteria bacterium]